MEYPSTRKEAQATGATHYFTGIPCKHGHIAPRETKGNCTECRKVEWQASNDKRKLSPKSEASKAAGKRYYRRNTELVKAKAMARPAEKQRQYKKKYKKANPELYKALVNSRRRRLKDCTPACQTAEDRRAIREIYAAALRIKKITGINYEVDHQIPILCDNVCGLHVPWNLEIMTESQNQAKSNTY